MVTFCPPRARSASSTFSIAAALACSAARAVAARDSTPAEICARSGTAVTTPAPLTVTVSAFGAGSTALAPSGRRTPARAAVTSTRLATSAIRFIGFVLQRWLPPEIRRRGLATSPREACSAAAAEALACGGDRVDDLAGAGRRARGNALGRRPARPVRPVTHRGGDLLVRVAERDTASDEIFGNVGRKEQRVAQQPRRAARGSPRAR